MAAIRKEFDELKAGEKIAVSAIYRARASVRSLIPVFAKTSPELHRL
jgi:hypothetical protein